MTNFMTSKCCELINSMLAKDPTSRPSTEKILNSPLILEFMTTFNLSGVFPLRLSEFFDKKTLSRIEKQDSSCYGIEQELNPSMESLNEKVNKSIRINKSFLSEKKGTIHQFATEFHSSDPKKMGKYFPKHNTPDTKKNKGSEANSSLLLRNFDLSIDLNAPPNNNILNQILVDKNIIEFHNELYSPDTNIIPPDLEKLVHISNVDIKGIHFFKNDKRKKFSSFKPQINEEDLKD